MAYNLADSKKRRGQSPKPVAYIALPYDFVPFAEKVDDLPYNRDNVPKHDEKDGLSGYLSYNITPYSDLALEVRTKRQGGYFVSGSQIRGRIRANLEILSASYPEFIACSPMLYRDFTGKLKNSYSARIGLSEGIERAVRVGFLRKVDQEFYIAPARQIGDKNFLSIKEHRLRKMGLSSTDKKNSFLYRWDSQTDEEFNELQKQIDRKTNEIRLCREKVSDKLLDIQKQLSNVFHKKYNFNTILSPVREKLKSLNKDSKKVPAYTDYISDINRLGNELLNDLQAKVRSKDADLDALCHLTVERWKLKAEIDIKYYLLSLSKKNTAFIPYQRNVYYKANAGQGIEKIAFEASTETPNKAYLFNSTNASSKRSHYFVLGPAKDQDEYPVSQSVIEGYKQNLKKFRTTEVDSSTKERKKKFYDIFDNYEALQKESGNSEGLIVFFHFFKEEESEQEEPYVGRTPYFKIPYKHRLKGLLATREKDRVDYAGALFGYISDEQGGDDKPETAYKSRLRFSPVDIGGNLRIENKTFLLPTPYASASAMYLQQSGNELQTYEQEKPPQLNGYKYYRILKNPHTFQPPDDMGNMSSGKRVIGHSGIDLKGKIYFNNLTGSELGLLLLSIDLKQLLKSEKYKKDTAEYRNRLEQTYDLLGGAKSYGFGKVKMEIQNLELEKNGKDFESLVLEPMEPVEEWHEYIDDFITKMGGPQYFTKVHFEQYVQSKLETDDTPITWGDQKLPKGGYPENWRLKRRK